LTHIHARRVAFVHPLSEYTFRWKFSVVRRGFLPREFATAVRRVQEGAEDAALVA